MWARNGSSFRVGQSLRKSIEIQIEQTNWCVGVFQARLNFGTRTGPASSGRHHSGLVEAADTRPRGTVTKSAFVQYGFPIDDRPAPKLQAKRAMVRLRRRVFFPTAGCECQDEVRQSVSVISDTTAWRETGLDFICLDRITRRQDCEFLISIIMPRWIAFQVHGLLQNDAVRAGGQGRFVVVVEGDRQSPFFVPFVAELSSNCAGQWVGL